MIDLPDISPLAAGALARLAPRLPAPFDFAGSRLFAVLAERGDPPPPQSWLEAGAAIGPGRALLHIAPEVMPASVAELWPDIHAVGVPDDLRLMLQGALLAELDDLANRLSGERPEWLVTEASACPYALTLRREGPDGAPLARVALDDAAIGWLADRMDARSPLRAGCDDLPTALSLRLDGFVMSAAELAEIEPGDVVLLDRDPILESGALAVVLFQPGGPSWRAALQGGGLSILSIPDTVMTNPETLASDAFDDLPLEVSCEVGRLTLPLSALREIAVGQVMDLGGDATSGVSLRVNGHVVAKGELVRITDRVGVRLTEVKASRT